MKEDKEERGNGEIMAIGAGCFGSIFRGSGNQKIQCGRLVKWNFTMMMVRSLLLLPLCTWFNFDKTTTLKLLHLMSGWLPIGCSDSWENKIRIRLFAIHFILFSASCGLAGRGRNIRRKSSQKGGGNYSRKIVIRPHDAWIGFYGQAVN